MALKSNFSTHSKEIKRAEIYSLDVSSVEIQSQYGSIIQLHAQKGQVTLQKYFIDVLKGAVKHCAKMEKNVQKKKIIRIIYSTAFT